MASANAIPGPRGPIPFERDELGYPRIRARDVADGAFALGWLQAIDRGVQVRLALLAAQGRLLELLGDQPFLRRSERALRAFNLGDGAQSCVDAASPDARTLVHSFCDGFNAGSRKRGYPLLLRLLGLPDKPYTPADLVQVYRAAFYFGITSMQLLVEVLVGELIAADAPREALEILVGDAVDGLDTALLSTLRWPDELRFLQTRGAGGSNAFALSPARSRTGGALVMYEPHMEVARFPPCWYMVHIDYPGGDYCQGASLPGIPWMTVGRNRHVAWGYTYAHADCVDVLVERCRHGRYLAAGEWRPLRRRIETVQVRGRSTPEAWVYWDNEYGTVLGDADGEGDFPCLRWAGIHDTTRDLDAVMSYFTARNVRELADAHRRMWAGSGHTVLADDSGALAYVQTGIVDSRPRGWSGAVPRPGWDLASRTPAPIPESSRPAFLDPPEGFLASANERRDGPHGERWCTVPEPPYRHQRLTQLLEREHRADLDTLVRASYDDVDLCAARLLPIWEPLLPADDAARELCAWAKSQRPGGGAGQRLRLGLFHALHREAVRRLFRRHLGAARADALVDFCQIVLMTRHHIDAALALEKPRVLDADGLREVLAEAWPAAQEVVNAGRALTPVRTSFRNLVFDGKLPGFLGFDSPELELPGGPTVPFQCQDIRFGELRIIAGPVFHLAFDMSRPGGWYNIGGGAAEQRLGPGYGKGVEDWIAGRFHPLGDASGPAPALGIGPQLDDPRP